MLSSFKKNNWFICVILYVLIFFPFSGFAQEQILIQQTFEDWTYRCVVADQATDNKQDQCELFQSVLVKEPLDKDEPGDQNELTEVLQVGFSKVVDQADKVEWALFVLIPLNVYLASDFALRIGESKAILARYRNCSHQGCLVVIPMTQASITRLKKAAIATGAFRLVNGQNINISFSLIGFTRAFNALVAQKKPQSASNGNKAPDKDIGRGEDK